jgi:hypothetical protein
MKWLSLVLAVGLTACNDSSGPTRLNIRAEGHVTLASDGTPVVGAVVTVRRIDEQDFAALATAETNRQGFYSLSFDTNGPCEPVSAIPSPFSMSVSSPGLLSPVSIGFPECTDSVQTRDIEMQALALADSLELNTDPYVFAQPVSR